MDGLLLAMESVVAYGMVCAEVVHMKEKLKGVGHDWATTLDNSGKSASAALKEFNDLLAEAAAKK